MKKMTVAILALLLALSLAGPGWAAPPPLVEPMAGKTQVACPVQGGRINKELYVHYQGQRVYFCCPACIDIFNKNPAFGSDMLAMGGAFAFMGGAAGFCLGAWYLQKERWIAEKIDSQKRLVALETLRDLMVTLAHHIRNSNLVIGGFGRRLEKHLADPELKAQLQMIQQASREIEAVIASLQHLTEISTVKYISEGQARMIDLQKELVARLAALKEIKGT